MYVYLSGLKPTQFFKIYFLKAQFILKTDDDQYVDLYEALVLTSRYSLSEQYVKNRFILCPVLRGLPILVR